MSNIIDKKLNANEDNSKNPSLSQIIIEIN